MDKSAVWNDMRSVPGEGTSEAPEYYSMVLRVRGLLILAVSSLHVRLD